MIAPTLVGPDRWKLGFREAVLSSFTFLAEYGMAPVKEEITLVRFESKRAFINIYHGRSSYEIGVEAGQLGRSEKYRLGRMVAHAGAAAWEREGFGRHTMFQVSTREGVQKFVTKVADLVRRYGEPFLRGTPAFYRDLGEEDARWAGSYERRQKIKDARRAADAARVSKDLAAMAVAYESIKPELTELEKKRLAYARSKLKKAV